MKIFFHGSKSFFIMGLLGVFIIFYGIFYSYSSLCRQKITTLFSQNIYIDKEIEMQNKSAVNNTSLVEAKDFD